MFKGSPARPVADSLCLFESYPPDVWKTFIFDQETVTRKMGATPNGLRDEARPVLFELVHRSRAARQSKSKPRLSAVV